jgi:undecaprenyl-diphosphatase
MLDWRYRDLDPDLRKSFEVGLHAGGALALLIGLRGEVADYLRSFGVENLINLTLSFAPAALAALAFEGPIERRLSRPRPVALALIGGAAAMAAADGFPEERTREAAAAADALAIGLAQACALMPGVSRNGATLSAARVLRFRRPDANVISRQVALPVIMGAAVLKGVRLTHRGVPPGVAGGMLAGAGAAFVSTLASMRLIALLERSRSLLPYAAYRTALGAVALLRGGQR